MVFDCPNICNTILSLGLGYINSTNTNDHHLRLDQDSKPSSAKSGGEDQPFPSLSLALPSDQKTCRDTNHDHLSSSDLMHAQGQQQASSGSATAASSFSNSSVKREIREVSGDQEVEEERVSPAKNLADQEQDEEGPRKKLRLTKEQSLVLEESFKEHSTLNPKQKQALANKLNLRPRQVEVWFQNRRARTKLKQTEVDFEMLKKCCETLKEENKRLHKEVQDLKATKVAVPPTPFYMQIPAATLSMCPSCETISASTGGGATGGSGENSSRISFSIGPKPHFYNPFTNHPSAAC